MSGTLIQLGPAFAGAGAFNTALLEGTLGVDPETALGLIDAALGEGGDNGGVAGRVVSAEDLARALAAVRPSWGRVQVTPFATAPAALAMAAAALKGELPAQAELGAGSEVAGKAGIRAAGVVPAGKTPPVEGDIKRAVAEYIIRMIEGAIAQRIGLEVFRKELLRLFPRSSVLVILFDRIGASEVVDERSRAALQREFGGDTEVVGRLLGLWHVYITGVRMLLTKDEWAQSRDEVRMLVSKRLDEMGAGGRPVDPAQVAERLIGGPVAVLGTFHNVIFGSGRDEPRKTQTELVESLSTPDAVSTHIIGGWSRFWTAEAGKRNWQVKPVGLGQDHDVDALMKYAVIARWDIRRVANWLEKMLRGDSDRMEIVNFFYIVFDRDVISGSRERPAERPTYSEMEGAKEGMKRGYSFWVNRWTEFARALGEVKSLRPPKRMAIAGMKKGRRKTRIIRDLFAAAAKMSDPVERARALHRGLIENGMAAEAAVVENLLVGLNDGPRMTVQRLSIEGHSMVNRVKMESRLTRLARAVGFPVKREDRQSTEMSRRYRRGKRMDELRRQALENGWGPERFLTALEADPLIKDALGDRAEVTFEIFRQRVAFSGLPGASSGHEVFVRGFKGRIDRTSFETLWKRMGDLINGLY